MSTPDLREIRFNYTSADDRQVVHAAARRRGLGGDRAAARPARDRPPGAPADARARRDLHPPAQPLPGRGARARPAAPPPPLRQPRGRPRADRAPGRRRPARCPRCSGASRALLAAFRREVVGAAGRARADPPQPRRDRRRGERPVRPVHAGVARDRRHRLAPATCRPPSRCRPRTAQVQPLLAAIAALGLHAIPRGAGTGLTGGAVPLRAGCVVVNTERLDRIRGIEERAFALADGRTARAHVMSLEAGVVTERAMEAAAERGLNFATDPTSAWACTIGGNIAENAGGKTAVRYGTCIDNLLAWSVAMPGGTFTVRRLDHPLRKILPGDTVRWRVEDARRARGAHDRARRRARSAGPASGRTSRTRRSAGCRGCRRRAPTASSPPRSSSCTRSTRPRPRSAWSSSATTWTRRAR